MARSLRGPYLLYLAWKIAMSRSVGDGKGAEGRPMRFIDAAVASSRAGNVWIGLA